MSSGMGSGLGCVIGMQEDTLEVVCEVHEILLPELFHLNAILECHAAASIAQDSGQGLPRVLPDELFEAHNHVQHV